MAVVAAVEFHDLVPARKAPGHPDGAHDRLRTGGYHAHHFHPGNHGADLLCHFHLNCGGGAVAEAPGGGLLNGLPDLRPVVAQDHGAPGADKIQVFLAVHIPQAAAVGLSDEGGTDTDGAEGPDGTVDTAGNIALGLPEQGFRLAHPIFPSFI